MSTKAPLTVTQINELVRMTLDASRLFSSVSVIGEISNMKVHFASGHIYFSLKDADSVIKCVMFRAAAGRLAFTPENGLKVIVKGKVSVYPRDGQYQLYADEMEPDGLGSRYLAFEQLKEKLSGEGLFDEDKKQLLPQIPNRVGVITSASGAAFQDILNVLRRRFPLCEVLLYPASVQGAEAPASLLAGVRWFSAHRDAADVLIIGRGGGSFEDLNAFNDEALARAVASCPIPVISAVGHETDFTICDFVSDKRAPTPSAAAEMATPDIAAIADFVSDCYADLCGAVHDKIERLQDRVRVCSENRMLSSPMESILEKERQYLQLKDGFMRASEGAFREREMQLVQYAEKLSALNPLSVLRRGYAAVFGENGEVVSGVDGISVKDTLRLQFANGNVTATVIQTERKDMEAQWKTIQN